MNTPSDALTTHAPSHWKIEPIARRFSERRSTVSDEEYPPLSVTNRGILPQLANVAKTDNGANRKLVRKGDFAINSRSDRKGSAGIAPMDGSVSVITTVLQPREMVPSYVHYLLRSEPFQEDFYRWGHGIVDDLWSTKWTYMKAIKIPVPPLDEQRAIADYLDRETTQIDAFIAKNNELRQLAVERQAVHLTQLLTGSENQSQELIDTGLPWIPRANKNWRLTPLRALMRRKKTEVGNQSSIF